MSRIRSSDRLAALLRQRDEADLKQSLRQAKPALLRRFRGEPFLTNLEAIAAGG